MKLFIAATLALVLGITAVSFHPPAGLADAGHMHTTGGHDHASTEDCTDDDCTSGQMQNCCQMALGHCGGTGLLTDKHASKLRLTVSMETKIPSDSMYTNNITFLDPPPPKV